MVELRQGPKINFKSACVELNHGSGGRASFQLIQQLFLSAFHNPWLAQQNDAASVDVPSGRMVMSTDAHVVSPLFFPGGNIGSLSVNGTLNDIAMLGATPLYLSASFILEEGFPLRELQTIVMSMASCAKEAGVFIITGDTKVVERGKADGVFITTTGIGMVHEEAHISGDRAKPGDKVIINGSIGDHGIAIMAHRHQLRFQTPIKSDTVALHGLVAHMIEYSPNIHCLRDPTRGGLATSLNEIARQSRVGFIIDENQISIRNEVKGVCELLGIDPLYVANEGKLIAICAPEEAEGLVSSMHQHPLGKEATIIGDVIEDPRWFVQLKTKLGGTRIMDWLVGEQSPRIC